MTRTGNRSARHPGSAGAAQASPSDRDDPRQDRIVPILTSRHGQALADLPALSPTLTEHQVYEALRTKIVKGLPAGTVLGLNELSMQLQTSTMPIRAALVRLEAEGLVVKRPHRSALVSALSEADFIDLYSIRRALEPIACRLGAAQLTPASHRAMEALLDEMVRACRISSSSERINAYLKFDWQLHDVCHSAAQRPKLLKLIRDCRRQAERYFRMYLSDDNLLRDIEAQRFFVDACVRNDQHSLTGALMDLYEMTERALLPVLSTASGRNT